MRLLAETLCWPTPDSHCCCYILVCRCQHLSLAAVLRTFCMKLPHNLTNAGQTAEVEGAILLIDQAAGANLNHLQSWPLSYKMCDVVQYLRTSLSTSVPLQ